jgi:protein TonB
MRLTTSLLAATALHGVVVASAAAVLSRVAPARPAATPATVEVEVMAPAPDPVAEAVTSATEGPTEAAAPARARTRSPHRHVGLALDPSTRGATGPATMLSETQVPAPGAATHGDALADPTAPAGGGRAPDGSATMLSATPRYRTNPRPDYPLPCKRRREEGTVLLNVFVQTDGLPATVSLNRSSGHPLLDASALAAVRRWTFEPARAAGLAVSSLVVVPVRFSLLEPP